MCYVPEAAYGGNAFCLFSEGFFRWKMCSSAHAGWHLPGDALSQLLSCSELETTPLASIIQVSLDGLWNCKNKPMSPACILLKLVKCGWGFDLELSHTVFQTSVHGRGGILSRWQELMPVFPLRTKAGFSSFWFQRSTTGA